MSEGSIISCSCGEKCWAHDDPTITTPCSGAMNVSEDFPGSYTHYCDGHGHYEDREASPPARELLVELDGEGE